MVSSKIVVFDLDGVLFRGEQVIPEAPRCLERLRAAGKRLFFLTNNSTQPRRVYVEKLTRLGMPCVEEEIVTSASATAAYFTDVLKLKNGRIFSVGGPGIREEFERVGFTVSSIADPKETDSDCSHLVVGLDRAFTYETLLRAQQLLLTGAGFVATNRDAQYPVENGVTPGAGSIVAAIAAAADREPLVIGKPEPHGLLAILDRAGVDPGEALMIGDRTDTDILCGNRCGVPGVLVLTGVMDAARVAAAPSEEKPERVIATLDELF
jgi:4-nitrophenyl phosphatase